MFISWGVLLGFTIVVFDGAKTIGGNKIYVCEGAIEEDKGLFLDFGMNYAKREKIFSDFLSERSIRGIHDLVYLNLVPRLNIYREDLIPSDLDVSSFPSLNVEAVLLSHAHLDHCGNIGLLRLDIPVVTSAISAAILKGLRDTSPAMLGKEVAYFSPKEQCNEDNRVLKSSYKGNYLGRNFYSTSKCKEEFYEFLSSRPGDSSPRARKVLEPGNSCHVDEKELSFDFKTYPVDHSIYGANAYLIYGDSVLAYTGDFRLHGKNAWKSEEFVKAAKEASILLIEGTRVGIKEEAEEEDESEESEEIVYETCLKAVDESEGLVIADFSPRHFERLETFKEIAEKTGKQLVVTSKDAYMLHAVECCDGINRMEDVLIYNELKETSKCKWEVEIVKERWGDNYLDPVDISRNPENYIACFSYYDVKHLLDIKPNNGSYIYSSSEAFQEEQEFNFFRLYNWLDRFNFRIYGFEILEEEAGGKQKPIFIKGYHASGHASEKDIRRVIDTIDPEIVIPIHTENPEWFSENFENAMILEEGKKYEF